MQYHLEQLALDRAFQNYEALGLDGLLLLDGDKPIAMTIGSLISPTVYDVNFEKALGEVPGDYAMINRTFARYIREKYPQVQYLDRRTIWACRVCGRLRSPTTRTGWWSSTPAC